MQVSITEMYDMNTVKGKLGIFAIHTPSMSSIGRRWHGLMDNHKFVRVVKCDLSVACASVLPADPLQVGVDSDQIAPQDVMNPILYRAVSNDAWNTVINRVYQPASGGSNFNSANDVRYSTDGFSGLTDDLNEKLYYGLLAEGGWKKAMPQAGFSMNGLVPIVYPVLSTYGNTVANGVTPETYLISENTGGPTTPTSANTLRPITFKGHAQHMPRVPCHMPGSAIVSNVDYPQFTLGSMPRTYVACIVMPPNKSGNVLYFRMVIRWTLEFSGLVTAIEKESAGNIAVQNNYVYTRTYDFPSSKFEDVVEGDDVVKDTNSVDALNMEPTLIMEK